MPNPYYYFESGEISNDRLLLEIEILKQLKEINLLDNRDWTSYDTAALQIFLQNGIDEVYDELYRRSITRLHNNEQHFFITECRRKYQTTRVIKENLKRHKLTSFSLIFNIAFVFISFAFLIGLFIDDLLKYNYQYHLFSSLDRPLTTKRRHLSFTDDLPIICLTFTSGIILGCIIIAAKRRTWLMMLGIIALIMNVLFLIGKFFQVISFLSTYRELCWSLFVNPMYS